MLSEAEWHQVIVEWNETATEYPRHLCLHEMFEQQASRTPDAIALQFAQTDLSYRELNERANQLAHQLIGLGVGPEMIVGVFLTRSPDLIIALLAIMKAGAAYLPMDPSYPLERLSLMLDECSTEVIVTWIRLAEQLPSEGRKLILLDDPMAGIERYPTTTPSGIVTPENLAYVIYTSGSTGQPKGVAIPHRSVVNVTCWTNTRFPMGRGDVFLQIAPFTFDVSVFEIFTALLCGAKLLLAKPGGQREPDYLVRLILSQGVTVASFVPPTLRMVIENDSFGSIKTLRRAFCGGEVMPLDLMIRFQQRSPAELVNLYGPTEVTVYCTGWVCARSWRELAPPIGKPIFNTQVYVLDEQNHPVPINCVGEIYLGGDGLARGYINRPAITAERFIRNPFSDDPSSRIYKSGDLGFWRADGTIAFVGRIDEQIKLRGFRIEPAEVEIVLLRSPEIAQALVVCREDTPGNQQLVAYCISSSGRKISSTSELRRLLAKSLPDYMIPSVFVEMESFPLNVNGKRDRKALPPPSERVDANEGGGVQRLPKDLLEQRLIELWEKVLGRKNIGIHDNFFDLGGHSLTAALLASEIDKLVYEKLPIAVFFQTPTVAELADYLKRNKDDPAWSSLVPLQSEGSKTPLFIMHGMGGDVYAYLYFSRLLAPDRPVYGLQTAGLDGMHPNGETIEEMAAHYADQIRALHPSGSYYLMGYSLGGWIAYAVAQQLIKKGGSIALLLLLDTEAEANVSIDVRLRMHRALHLEQAFLKQKGLLALLNYGLRLLKNQFRKRSRARAVPTAIDSEALNQKKSDEAVIPDYFETVCRRYSPPKLDLFVNLIIPSERKEWQVDFWHSYARKGVKIDRLFETHADFIDPPKAAPLADLIRKIIQERESV